jgi:hypothetical protein
MSFLKTAAVAAAFVAGMALSSCSSAQQTAFDSNLTTTTQDVVALNNALITVNNTLIGNAVAQAKLLAPYQCGAYALAAAIINDSSAEAKVNAFLQKSVAASVATVAVKDICAALGQSTTVTAAPPSSTTAAASGG